MNHARPGLQIHLHKVDGSTTTFVQHDAGEVKKLLDEFQPARLFNRERFVFTDKNSISSLPVSKITRLDLVSEPPGHPVFPAEAVDAVELTETQFEALVRNPVLQEQWRQMTAQDDGIVTFLDLEMADGQRLFLTMETPAGRLEPEGLEAGGFAFNGSGLCFQMQASGVAVLNLAHVIRLTFYPKPAHPHGNGWLAGQFEPPPARRVAGDDHDPAVSSRPPADRFRRQ
jgi:hypothetical protein